MEWYNSKREAWAWGIFGVALIVLHFWSVLS